MTIPIQPIMTVVAPHARMKSVETTSNKPQNNAMTVGLQQVMVAMRTARLKSVATV